MQNNTLVHFPETPSSRDHSCRVLRVSQKLWFEGDFIPKALVGNLEEEEMANKLQMRPTVWKVTTRTRMSSGMTINHHRGVHYTHILPLLLKGHGHSLFLSIYD